MGMNKLCKDCEHFKILFEPQVIGGECWDWGQARCEKHDMVVDFKSHSKFKWLSCVEAEEEQEPTTKNEAKYCDRNICLKNEYNNIGCEDCEVTKSQEPTTKNDLGVDAVSRQAVLDLIADYDLSMGQVVRGIHTLPSVTPQESRWIPVSERLPDTDDEVLCWYEYYHWSQEKILPEYGIGQFFDNRWFGEVSVGKDIKVLAWMPLPAPYDPQESEDKE